MCKKMLSIRNFMKRFMKLAVCTLRLCLSSRTNGMPGFRAAAHAGLVSCICVNVCLV